jgi:Flp pilus assembly protein TadG
MMKAGRRSGRSGRRRGAAAAELALILPVLMLIVLICVDFGRFAYHQIAVNNAARAGAEYAIMNPYLSSGSTTWQAAVQSTAQAELANQTNCDPTDLTTTTTVTIESSGLRRVRVVASYSSFQTVVPWPGIPSSTTLTSSVEMWAIR